MHVAAPAAASLGAKGTDWRSGPAWSAWLACLCLFEWLAGTTLFEELLLRLKFFSKLRELVMAVDQGVLPPARSNVVQGWEAVDYLKDKAPKGELVIFTNLDNLNRTDCINNADILGPMIKHRGHLHVLDANASQQTREEQA